MPVDLLDQEMYMRATLIELRDKWFTVDEKKLDWPCTWFPTQSLPNEIRVARIRIEMQSEKGMK